MMMALKLRRQWVVGWLGLVVAVWMQIMLFCPISPDSDSVIELPSSSLTPLNKELQKLVKLGEGFVKDAEDVCVDESAGIVYVGSRNGWINRLHPNGSWENWKNAHSQTLLGLAPSPSNHQWGILVCDTQKGILKVNEDGCSVLVSSHVNQTRMISFADDVVEAADGNIYLSDASSKFGLHNWYLDFLEAKPHGRLLKYDPSSHQISTLLDNLHFANGVALSADQSYVVVCETFKYRCVKYWVKGQKQGETEILIDHLPGAPDNVNLAPDGSFWIALLHPIRDGWELVVRSKMARYILATFPNLCDLLVNGVRRRATVVKVGENGRILRKLDDPDGKVISFLTSAVEFQDHLYLGSLNADFLGKLPLTDT
ncbi:protein STRICTOSIDINE SYNTHASE-LIKE 4-like isoform X2 [Cucumis melo]|uniref:Protein STRICTOSIDINE SYNTHASE-LIKE 4-like isoform X2 n=1 Tax=Cucumis melo TaxID=3656 RepID=A0A1S3CBE0_CUCME|nr:protein STRICTOSIDINE SYNTHASE-LIKE 4-like isoform X2 [Cucumis melo]